MRSAQRLEHDLLGERAVPAQAYYGVHTLRALENFPITGIPISVYPALVNALACVALVFGRFGAPALGPAGAGWATTASRVYMLGCLVAYVAYREWRHPTGLDRVSLAADWPRLATLMRLGFPAALQITAEVGVFTVVTTLAGRFEPAVLAAHQIGRASCRERV